MNSDKDFNNPFDEDEQNDSTSAIDQTDMVPLDEDSGGRSLAWLILGVAAVVCGLLFAAAFFFFQPDAQSLMEKYFPSPTATFTPTPTQTPTPNLTATQQVIRSTATAVAIQTTIAQAGNEWKVLISDTFDNGASQWSTGTDDDEYATIIRKGLDKKYQWEATAKKGFISWISANETLPADFYLSVEARRISGSSLSDYGLVFREDTNSNFYYIGVDEEGFFVSVNYENEWIDVVDYTRSSAVLADGTNRITVIARGAQFIFLINDEFVAEATDDHIPTGRAALAIQIYEADEQATFEFDNFEVRVP